MSGDQVLATNNQAKVLTLCQGIIVLQDLRIENSLIFADLSPVIDQRRKPSLGGLSSLSWSVARIKGLIPCLESIDFHILCSCNPHADAMENKAVTRDKGALVKNGVYPVIYYIPWNTTLGSSSCKEETRTNGASRILRMVKSLSLLLPPNSLHTLTLITAVGALTQIL